jgi:hypothetical protein
MLRKCPWGAMTIQNDPTTQFSPIFFFSLLLLVHYPGYVSLFLGILIADYGGVTRSGLQRK